MHKLLSIICITLAIALVSFNAFAIDCPPGQERKGWKCVDIEDDETTGIVNNNNNDNSNRNTNTNLNTNANTNLNSNTQGQAQGQLQGQAQLQGQVQGQAQSANNEGNHQSITIKEADNPVAFSHIGSGVGKTDADLKDTISSNIRTYSSIFRYDNDEFITIGEAKAMSGGSIKVTKAIMREANVQLKNLNWADTSGEYMGS